MLLYFEIKNKSEKLIKSVKAFLYGLKKDESGMGTLEVIIIIAVLVTLALVFRNFIMDIAGMVFDKIKGKTDATINSL